MKKIDRFTNWKYPKIEEGKPTKYNWVVQNLDGLNLGTNTDIGAFSYINAKHEVVIEDEVQIGSHCSIYSVSTIDNSYGKVVLKNNCRIGSHTTILPGVSIGKNSIIGGECSTPGIITLIGVCNSYKTKKLIELNEKSNVLVIGCEGNADVKLYKQLLSKGRK